MQTVTHQSSLPAHVVACPDPRTCLALATVLEAEGVDAAMISPTAIAVQPEDQPRGITAERLRYVASMFQFQNN